MIVAGSLEILYLSIPTTYLKEKKGGFSGDISTSAGVQIFSAGIGLGDRQKWVDLMGIKNQFCSSLETRLTQYSTPLIKLFHMLGYL